MAGTSIWLGPLAAVLVATACGTKAEPGDETPPASDTLDCSWGDLEWGLFVEYGTMAELEVRAIKLFAEWLVDVNLELTPEQQDRLAEQGDLAGELTDALTRPVKYPNGRVEMPPNWLPAFSDDHPWQTPPETTDALFPAWFQYRVVHPLLFDPDDPKQVEWAKTYLSTTEKRTMIASLNPCCTWP